MSRLLIDPSNTIAALTVDDRGIVNGVSAAALALLDKPAKNVIGASLDALIQSSQNLGHCVTRLDPSADRSTTHVVILEPHIRERPDHDEAQLCLAAGIAHDFDNLLAIISGHLQMAQSRNDSEPVCENLKQSQLACAIAARMTRRLRTFASRQPLDAKPHDINALIRPVADVLGEALHEQRSFACELQPDLPPIMIDRSEFENALLNLLLNALDATSAGGTISIATRLEVRAAERSHVMLVVADNGTGMPDHIAQRAFEPFYSTKPPDKGTGLGLATVAGFTRQSGGSIELSTVAGIGTAVTLRFPIR